MTATKERKQVEYFNPFEPVDNTLALRQNLSKIDNKDLRTKFKATSDPIHLAFDTIDNTPLKTLAKDFIKESLFDFADFIVSFCR